jgi:polyisoprenoid-binding protein YceI
MKTNLKVIALGLLFIFLTSFNTNSKIEKTNSLSHIEELNRLLPEKLRGIDYGIQGSHFPNPTYATLEDGMYVWKHDTSVKATFEDLQIVEYGSYIYTDKGWYLRVTYDNQFFAKTYNCKDGILKKGKTYTDPTSWRKSEKLFAGDAMWFYIAKNKAGKLFKGTALVETEAKLITENKTLNFDTKKSNVSWTGYGEVGNYSLTGNVNLKSGNVTIVDDKIVSGTIVIDLKSIHHTQNSLVEHLKSKDFFEVIKYPTATLKITKSKTLTDNSVEITGNLTIKKTTKVVTFTMKRDGDNFSGKITLDRTAFGVEYGSKNFFDNLGDQAIKNEFDLEFKLVATKKPSL